MRGAGCYERVRRCEGKTGISIFHRGGVLKESIERDGELDWTEVERLR